MSAPTLAEDLAVLDESDLLFVARRMGSLQRFAHDGTSAPLGLRGGIGAKVWAALTPEARLAAMRAVVVAESATRRRGLLRGEEAARARAEVKAQARATAASTSEREARQAAMIRGLVGVVPCSACGSGEYPARAGGRAVVRFCDPCAGRREGERRAAERARRSDRLAREGKARAEAFLG
jgi:hypothetical protein